MEAEELRVGFVGAGRMAGGLVRGLLRAGMGGDRALDYSHRARGTRIPLGKPQVCCPAL